MNQTNGKKQKRRLSAEEKGQIFLGVWTAWGKGWRNPSEVWVVFIGSAKHTEM